MRLTEKYRPRSWGDVIGQEEIISSLKDLVERLGLDCTHLLFIGPPGTGKSSTAYIVRKTLEKKHGKDSLVGIPILEHNASDFRGIDFIRNDIKKSVSFKVFKIIFLDEADNLTDEAQQSLRRIMEKAMTTLFILSGNNPDGFIDAIKSRCAVYAFQPIPNKAVKEQLLHIINAEGYVLGEDASIHAVLCAWFRCYMWMGLSTNYGFRQKKKSCVVEIQPREKPLEDVGIDVGLHSYAVLSDGTRIENPRLYRESEKKLAHLQRGLSRKDRGSRNWVKTKTKVARLHEKIGNRRIDFLQQGIKEDSRCLRDCIC